MRTYISLLSCFLFSITYLLAQEKAQARFTENKGQWDERIQYLLETNAGSIFFENQQFTYALCDKPADKHDKEVGDNSLQNIKSPCVSQSIFGVQILIIVSLRKAAMRITIISNLGNDPNRWKDHVYAYHSVTYKDLYEGIDVHVYGTGRNLKYDYLVSPSAFAKWRNCQNTSGFRGL